MFTTDVKKIFLPAFLARFVFRKVLHERVYEFKYVNFL